MDSNLEIIIKKSKASSSSSSVQGSVFRRMDAFWRRGQEE